MSEQELDIYLEMVEFGYNRELQPLTSKSFNMKKIRQYWNEFVTALPEMAKSAAYAIHRQQNLTWQGSGMTLTMYWFTTK